MFWKRLAKLGGAAASHRVAVPAAMADPSMEFPEPGLNAGNDAMDEDDDLEAIDDKNEKDLTGDGGLIKKILKAGEGWETPSQGDSVKVIYHGTLEDGTVFDSSRDRGDTFDFTIGQGQVIKGWDKGVITMKKGEKAILTCKAPYAYGAQGSPPKIPPDATLNFEVELISWKSIKDIAGDGGVIKTVETEGQGWEKPSDKDEALVRYSVRAEGSSEALLSSEEGGSVVLVGSGQPMKAFTAALKTMKQGERASLKIKPEYGFASPQPVVPEGALLDADLELITIRKVEDVTDDGKVQTKLLHKGKDYKRPNEGAKVKIAYTGRIGGPEGSVFEEHTAESPLEFVTDEDQVVEGLELAIMKHNAEETFEVTVAPEYGFGDQEVKRAQAAVPPNTQLHYTVQILEIEKAKEAWDLSDGEKVALAQKRKEHGNALFKASKWARAIAKYKSAAEAVGFDDKFPEEVRRESAAVKKSADLNTAAASLKLGKYKEAMTAATKVLQADSSNVKALFRRAQAHLAQQDHVEAELDIRAALLVEPNNKDVRALKQRYRKEAAAANAKDKAMYQRAFQKLAQMRDPEPEPEPKPSAKAEPQSHPIEDVGDEAGPGTSSMDVEVPVEAAQPAEHMHTEQNGVHEPAAAAAQPMAVES